MICQKIIQNIIIYNENIFVLTNYFILKILKLIIYYKYILILYKYKKIFK